MASRRPMRGRDISVPSNRGSKRSKRSKWKTAGWVAGVVLLAGYCSNNDPGRPPVPGEPSGEVRCVDAATGAYVDCP